MVKILSYEKQLRCNSKCAFLEKWGAGGFTNDIKKNKKTHGFQQYQLHMNFNRVEFK